MVRVMKLFELRLPNDSGPILFKHLRMSNYTDVLTRNVEAAVVESFPLLDDVIFA